MSAQTALDARLLEAHAQGDTRALIALYTEAADTVVDAQAFYLTHAYVFALECGAYEVPALRARLAALGSEPAE